MTLKTASTWCTAILWEKVDVKMGVRVRVSLRRGKKHEKVKKVHRPVGLRSVWTCSRIPAVAGLIGTGVTMYMRC